VEANALQAPNPQEGKAVVVLQAAELAFNCRAAHVILR
jgi:hypothetical protein